MKVGDLVKCGDEIAVVVDARWSTSEDQQLWLECYWPNGDLEGIAADDVEIINESR